MPRSRTMEDAVKKRYGQTVTVDEAMPQLIREFRTPYLIATSLGVYPNSVRFFLKTRGYKYEDGRWQLPEQVDAP